ncbi:MAG: ABC-F family ATP-binding cassette domain-containing protein [Bacteroidales bacterium]|jgi:ATP-binding cassette subfamily F protein uup|nr:ABC-F family ATP-binding cassette domain-containing protein [Bacteroidales bacterium]
MNLLLVENISKAFGENNLFENITFGIDKGQKVALVARNGAGKTTLLNIISGNEDADSGKITFRNDIKIAYLLQEPDYNPLDSVLDLIFSQSNELISLIKKYEKLLYSMQKKSEDFSQEEYQSILNQMDALQAWNYENEIKQILGKFGIEDLTQKVGELSGGQKKKIALASALIQKADFLILDEPTNHLDIDMIEWLEEHINNQNITLLMVTHDRYFLNNVCNEIIEIENNNVYRYKGKYEYFLEKKSERLELEKVEFEKFKSLYRKELQWMRTTPQARTTKSKSRIDSFYEIEDKVSKTRTQESRKFEVTSERMGSKILEINNIDFSFEDKLIIKDFSYVMKHGETIGVVGPNGCGKSTLLRLISGELRPDLGKIIVGQTVHFGFYTQELAKIDGNKRLVEILKEHAESIRLKNGNEISASQFLYQFGFSYNTQWNYYDKLSGGEKRRFNLLLVLANNPNFLLLDEPTNDFDIETMNLIEDFLMQFEGCALVVSHDRYLLDKICDHIFVFQGEGKIKDYYSSYTEYRQLKKRDEQIQKQLEIEKEPAKEKPRSSNRAPKRSYKEQKEYENLEIEIPELEEKLEKLVKILNSGETDAEKLQATSQEYENIQKDLDAKTERWIELDEIE